MTTNEGKSFLMDRYLDELKRMEEEHKSKDSSGEVQVLREQLRQLSAEMLTLRKALGFQERHGSTSCDRHTNNNNQDSGYSDNLADSLSASSSLSLSSTSSASSSSSTTPKNSCSCSSTSQMTLRRLTSNRYSRLNDLVRLPSPVTEETISHAIQQRWLRGETQTKLGPILVVLNPYRGLSQDQVLEHSQPSQHPQLQRLAQRIQAQLIETRKPQALILGGESGSGKTYTSQLFLRQLHSLCKRRNPGGGGINKQNGGKQFQNLVHAFHILQALGCAKTRQNSCASRMGHHIEVQLAGNTITRTKFDCHWFDQSRVVNTPPSERNFHVFYQMLAGLTQEERAQFHLHGYSTQNLAYLKQRSNSEEAETDKEKFNALRIALSALGIEFSDVMRVLAAILLLGNVQFVEDGGYELDIKGSSEIKAVASLLGVSGVSLYRALTTKTHSLKGQPVKTLCNADMANEMRDTLVKALYCRTVLAIVKRINSVFKQPAKSPPYVASSVNSEDTQSSGDSCSRLSDSTCETVNSLTPEACKQSEKTIHIIDLPGFSNSQCNRVEALCCNHGSELLHQVYLGEVFKTSQQACLEEGLQRVTPSVAYQDNSPCLDICSSKYGLFSTIDVMCNQLEQPQVNELLDKMSRRNHKNRVFAVERENKHLFTIRHTSGEVRYSATDFLRQSRDVITDDVLSIFRRKACSFGFATHLFAPELKLIQGNVAKGVLFRICPRPQTSCQGSQDASIGSLPLDSHQRLKEVLDSLTEEQAQLHFIHCIKINDQELSGQYSHTTVTRQAASFQLTATIQHLTEGFPHSLPAQEFVRRYRVTLARRERNLPLREQCRVILEHIMRRCELMESTSVHNKWCISKHRVFYSEETRQALESSRDSHRDTSARFLQSKVRCWLAWRHWPTVDDIEPYEEPLIHQRTTKITFSEPLYERIHLPDNSDCCSELSDTSSIEPKKARIQPSRPKDVIKDTPPPLPSNHPSSTKMDMSKGFPQTRIMRCNYSPDSSCTEPVLLAGEPILVMGVTSSGQKDRLIVAHNNCTLHVPLKLTVSQTGDCILGTQL